jgi:hypothetical protein
MITMNSRMHRSAGSLFAGAAALLFSTAMAFGANPDPQEATETNTASATVAAQATDRIGDQFATFAGSEANADALVTGLHDGTAINLTATAGGQTTTTTFTPTGTMSYRNAYLSLALAEAQLTKLGISQPTPAEIEAALAGGSVTTGSGSTATTTHLSGVLVLRGQNQNWTQIAQSLGVDLHSAITTARAASDTGETAEVGQANEGTPASARVVDRLSDRYATFAGGETNATALVNGLRSGTAVSLTATVNGQSTTTTFTPATGAMGYGNVALALSLAQQDLAKAGITQPTPAEIQAALEGGSVTTGSGSTAVVTQLTGVLALRTQGQGWGQIAQTLGVSLRPPMDADADDAPAMAAAKAAATANVVAAEDEHPDAAAGAAHLAAAVTVRPNVPAPAMVHVPEVGDVPRPEVPHVPETPHFERPEIPPQPMIPGRHGG